MIIRVLPVAARDVVVGALLAAGYTAQPLGPWSNGTVVQGWSHPQQGPATLVFCGRGSALGLRAPDTLPLPEGLPTLEEALRELTSPDPLLQIQTFGQLTALPSALPDDAWALLLEGFQAGLLHPEAAVRWAAWNVADPVFWPRLLDALEPTVREAAARYPDMAPAVAWWEKWRADAEAARVKAEGEAAKARARAEKDAEVAAYEAANQPALAYLAAVTALATEDDGPSYEAADAPAIRDRAAALPATLPEAEGRALLDALPGLFAAFEGHGFSLKALSDALTTLAPRAPALAAPLAFARALAMARHTGYKAAPLAREAAALWPQRRAPLTLLGMVEESQGEYEAAFAALDAALDATPTDAAKDRDDDWAEQLYATVYAPITRAYLYDLLSKTAASAKEFGRQLAASEAWLALAPGEPTALRRRALALTFLLRHEEAIAAYGDALPAQASDDDRSLILFNRACEHAFLGHRDAALADLAAAAALSGSWREKARSDDYFSSLRGDPDFLQLAWEVERHTLTPAHVAQQIRRAMGMGYRGAEGALSQAERAAVEADLLGDLALRAHAYMVWGNQSTYRASPTLGVARMETAVALAAALAEAGDDSRIAEATHFLGAAHHAAGDFAAAETHYRAALDLRIAREGAAAPVLAKSYGDLARLASDRGAPLAEMQALSQAGVAILDAALAAGCAEDDAIEAHNDRATLLVNLALTARQLQESEAALSALEAALSSFQALAAAGTSPQAGVLQTAARVCAQVGQAPEWMERAGVLRWALLVLEEPVEAAREERLWWAGVRLAARALMADGHAPEAVAAGFQAALRGQAPDWLTAHPALTDLPVQLARRLHGQTDLVMVALALSTAHDADSLDQALEQLQDLAIAERHDEAAARGEA